VKPSSIIQRWVGGEDAPGGAQGWVATGEPPPDVPSPTPPPPRNRQCAKGPGGGIQGSWHAAHGNSLRGWEANTPRGITKDHRGTAVQLLMQTHMHATGPYPIDVLHHTAPSCTLAVYIQGSQQPQVEHPRLYHYTLKGHSTALNATSCMPQMLPRSGFPHLHMQRGRPPLLSHHILPYRVALKGDLLLLLLAQRAGRLAHIAIAADNCNSRSNEAVTRLGLPQLSHTQALHWLSAVRHWLSSTADSQ